MTSPEKILEEAEYFICHQSTSLHEDFRVRLKEIDVRMYLKVRQLLAENRKAAPVRGGLAHKKNAEMRKNK